ncbi:MAG: DUF3990 domain-containing protein [Bacteroidales bacterium]|nr:DUF3990 domain-containing protein [Bacteroidales bacterium]
MIVYHGGFSRVTDPKILKPNRTMDFGCGFYTTTSFEQAQKWSLIKRDRFHYDHAIVSWYDFDESLLSNGVLKCLVFEKPDEAWLDFVVSNRRDINYSYDYDIVTGAVANDNVYASLNLYESGFIGKDELIKELMVWKYVDQICFHTERSLDYLKFLKSREVF